MTVTDADFGQKKFPIIILLLLALAAYLVYSVILRIEAGTRYSAKISAEFLKCQDNKGIKGIYLLQDRKFLRTCEGDNGSIIAQVLYKIGKDWFLKDTSVADNISDFNILKELYPNNSMPGYFNEMINQLLYLVIVR